jgi:hypothetical protein
VINRLETYDLCSFEEGIGISHVEQKSINLLVKNVSEVFCLYASWEFNFERSTAIIKSDYKEG